ncbi:THO complex subunit 4B-like isoform X1 [Chenopodium quinoa]|uniref:THO complex subunit 4B-like isoform X1 n=1 Tax=Chenopodium quinoa TaxID=63459 RepID=UPI000B798600|nr:THO complex subunit 4B-like isoform X1 [Chenopodium quinoa]
MAMENRLNMSLDDLIKINKSSSGRGGGGGGGRGRGGGGGRGYSGPGPSRRFNNRVANRSTPYSMPMSKAPDSFWQHDMFGNQGGIGVVGGGGGASSIETGTKLYISNLDYGVSNDDIKELFSEVGDLKRYAVHYDRSGRSKGTAEVVFSRRGDGLAAVKRYNNVELDGKPMKIEIVGTNVAAMGALPPVFNGLVRNPPGPRSGQGRGGAMGRIRGGRGSGSGSGRGRGRGRGRDEKASVSVDDLDADLDKYHSEAMQTN